MAAASTNTPPRAISLTGVVGPVRLAKSTQAEVVAALGPPEAEGQGNLVGGGQSAYANYIALGYECGPVRHTGLLPASPEGPPYCHTVYYIDAATGVLGGFWTSSRRYATSHGTRVGMSEARAAAGEHRPATIGCLSGISENGRHNFLYIGMRGGKLTKPFRNDEPYRLVGGHVSEIAIESRSNAVGNLFC
ncbi:MAG: hypothetical protein ACHQHO_11745 [Solirubrobacterales bacterium]